MRSSPVNGKMLGMSWHQQWLKPAADSSFYLGPLSCGPLGRLDARAIGSISYCLSMTRGRRLFFNAALVFAAAVWAHPLHAATSAVGRALMIERLRGFPIINRLDARTPLHAEVLGIIADGISPTLRPYWKTPQRLANSSGSWSLKSTKSASRKKRTSRRLSKEDWREFAVVTTRAV